jgi:hypothetical protein
MRLSSRFAFLALGLALLAGASKTSYAEPVPVITQFTFTGVCDDCTGTGVGVLTVENYTLGDEFTLDNFVDFTYTSNFFPEDSPFELTSPDVFNGSIGAATGPYDVFIAGGGIFSSQQMSFDTLSDWCLGGGCLSDEGLTHTWSLDSPEVAATPEPGTLSLIGTGVAFVATLKRRRFIA